MIRKVNSPAKLLKYVRQVGPVHLYLNFENVYCSRRYPRIRVHYADLLETWRKNCLSRRGSKIQTESFQSFYARYKIYLEHPGRDDSRTP